MPLNPQLKQISRWNTLLIIGVAQITLNKHIDGRVGVGQTSAIPTTCGKSTQIIPIMLQENSKGSSQQLIRWNSNLTQPAIPEECTVFSDCASFGPSSVVVIVIVVTIRTLLKGGRRK
jgi:hypothetical protein